MAQFSTNLCDWHRSLLATSANVASRLPLLKLVFHNPSTLPPSLCVGSTYLAHFLCQIRATNGSRLQLTTPHVTPLQKPCLPAVLQTLRASSYMSCYNTARHGSCSQITGLPRPLLVSFIHAPLNIK